MTAKLAGKRSVSPMAVECWNKVGGRFQNRLHVAFVSARIDSCCCVQTEKLDVRRSCIHDGEVRSEVPVDRQYSDNHLWLQQHGEVYRVGLTAYSVRLLQDVYFLDWTVDAGVEVRRKQEIGEVESSKALSSLYAPVDGFLVEFNDELLDDPSAINTDSYGKGWLYSMRTDSPLLSADGYLQALDESWEHAQRTIKGQIN